MFNFIKKLFSNNTSNDSDVCDTTVNRCLEEFYNNCAVEESNVVCDIVKEPIIYGNVNANKTLLLVDDQSSVFFLYDLDFAAIKARYGYDVLEQYKVIRCDGDAAGAIAINYIRNAGTEIVIAVLDLTLGTIIKLEDGTIVRYDGVDIALELIKLHTKCKIGVCTAHMLDDANPSIIDLINKFNTATGHSLLDYSFSKNSDRAEHIFGLIKDVDNNKYEDYNSSDA